MNRYLKMLLKLFLGGILLCLLAILFTFLCNVWVKSSTTDNIYNDSSKIPKNHIALVLGTREKLYNGRTNPYFKYRIKAAIELYQAEKVSHFIVSGDNHVHSYNEPEDMQQALMAAGVPEDKITLDFAGFRTLDSVVRCKKVFLTEKLTIISQEFHNQRALFIAKKYGMDVVAYNATDVSLKLGSRVMAREYFAKVKAVLDLYLLRKKPKFLGETIKIPK
ncbi:MAG: SanA/YdcF family protein [Saprospiraceae bacterium]